MRTTHRSGRRPQSRYLLGAAGLLLAGLAAAGLLGVIRDEDSEGNAQRPSATTTQTTQAETTPTTQTTQTTPEVDGAALNEEGFALMQSGDFESARPLLARAVAALRGSGSLPEAYASYNLAYTRFALGRCDGIIGLLDRSQSIQGERREIDALRRDWEQRCVPAGEAGDGGKGKGRGNGKGKDD